MADEGPQDPGQNLAAAPEQPGFLARIGTMLFQMMMLQAVMQILGSFFVGKPPPNPAGSVVTENFALGNSLEPNARFDLFVHLHYMPNTTALDPPFVVEPLLDVPADASLSGLHENIPHTHTVALDTIEKKEDAAGGGGIFASMREYVAQLTPKPIEPSSPLVLPPVDLITLKSWGKDTHTHPSVRGQGWLMWQFLGLEYTYERFSSSHEKNITVVFDPQFLTNDEHVLALITTIVPFSAYRNNRWTMSNNDVFEGLASVQTEAVLQQVTNLVEVLLPVHKNIDEHSLILSDEKTQSDTPALDDVPIRHLKTHIDIGLVYDTSVHNLDTLKLGPMQAVRVHPELRVYDPVINNSDFWLLEKDYMALNDTLIDVPVPMSFTFGVSSLHGWMLQQQMSASLQQQQRYGMQSLRESWMFKRILIETNPYMLVFSGLFILLHSVFSFFAMKNDMQFWYNNESMKGLSALSIVSSLICEIVIGLYLFDSQETSWLILFEVTLGVAMSLWKLSKAVKYSVDNVFPYFHVEFSKSYKESSTQNYDAVAIKYMSWALAPCVIGYAIYALLYNKYKSWYSYTISVLAGSVYTFGFIMMTPQLYINYKLQSVEHLPWRALIYKSLNTFVDDVASFLIDMPWLHRLSCFRDDIIFFCYLYQRWAYTVDKTRRGPGAPCAPTESVKSDSASRELTDTVESTADASTCAALNPSGTATASAICQSATAKLTKRQAPTNQGDPEE